MTTSDTPTHNTRRRLIWLLLLSGLAIILIWAGLKAWRTYRAAQSLLARQAEVEQLLTNGIQGLDADATEALVYGVRDDVVTLRDELGPLAYVAPYFDWLPRVGPLAAAAPHLLEMADAGTESAAYAFRGLKPALALLQNDTGKSADLIPEILGIVDAAQPDLIAASEAMNRVAAARSALGNTDELPWRVRTLLQQADAWLPVAQEGLTMAPLLPELMGHEGNVRYLILAQNQDELRPTGGFISGAGILELENGRILGLEFLDANQVDAWTDPLNTYGALSKPYDAPPEPLQELMLLDIFLFRDANYWPDFPRSAQQAMELYSYGRDVPLPDGVIAVDQQFLRLLVEATGAMTVPDTGDIINAGNLIGSLQSAWTLQDGVLERKSFLSTFSEAIRSRIETQLGEVDVVRLARNLVGALNDKHLQIYMLDPQVAERLDALGWNGRLPAPNAQDFLMVVDTNVGYNKANLFIERAAAYNVTLDAGGSAEAVLTITHTHTGPDDGEPCYQGTTQEYRERAGYSALADKCYWNFLRVYAPGGSQLISGPEHIVPAATWYGGYDWNEPTAVTEEQPGLVTFSSFLLVPKNAQVVSEFVYALPTVTQPVEGEMQYVLEVMKQAGTAVHPLEITVTLPPGASLVQATPQPTRIEGSTLIFVTELASDTTYTVVYR